jgi:hypothetical protein
MNTRLYRRGQFSFVVLFVVLAFMVPTLSGCFGDSTMSEPESQEDMGPPALVSVSTVVGSNTLDAAGTYQAETYFTLTNNSSEGVNIEEVIIDLTSANYNAFFDTEGGPPGAFFQLPFLTDQGLNVGLSGWVGTVDGTGDITDPFYTILGTNRVDDGARYLHMSFGEFSPGKTFTFRIDVDYQRGSYRELCLASCFQGAGVTILFTGPDMDATPVGDTYLRDNWRQAGF